MITHISPPSWASLHSPQHPSRSSQSTGGAPYVIQQLITSDLFYTWKDIYIYVYIYIYIYIYDTFSIGPTKIFAFYLVDKT